MGINTRNANAGPKLGATSPDGECHSALSLSPPLDRKLHHVSEFVRNNSCYRIFTFD